MPQMTLHLEPQVDVQARYRCKMTSETVFTETGSTDLYYQSEIVKLERGTFSQAYALPENIVITGAMLKFSIFDATYENGETATLSLVKINGTEIRQGYNQLPVVLPMDAKAFTFDFEYAVSPVLHYHGPELCYESVDYPPHFAADNKHYYAYKLYDHVITLTLHEIQLVIDYVPAGHSADLEDYTDPEIVAGSTYVKAMHMTQLQRNANVTRKSRGLGDYTFTEILPGETWLSGWNAHIQEIRAALDETGVAHDEWLALGTNCPRADVLVQLRRVLLHIRNCGEPAIV